MNNTDFSSILSNCRLCPRNCGVDRTSGNSHTGFCGQGSDINLARAALHFWEEPCISGTTGSGAVFFCGCNLRCVFCQNSDLANSKIGMSVSAERLSEIFLELQEQKAANINLITAGHFVPQVAHAIACAKDNGLTIPIVYNTGSYEYADTLKMLDGLIDIYLPDLKYMDSELGKRFSHTADYFDVATKAIKEMFSQVGTPVFTDDTNPLMKKGVIVRHLVLPNHTKDSCNILDYLYKTYGDEIFISIMNQYTPMPAVDCTQFPELTHTLTKRAYEKVINHAIDIGITNAFVQEGETFKDSFIPVWDYSGVLKSL